MSDLDDQLSLLDDEDEGVLEDEETSDDGDEKGAAEAEAEDVARQAASAPTEPEDHNPRVVMGNNVPPSEPTLSADALTNAAQGALKSFIERIERLAEDRAAVMDDTKEVFAEAKGSGFDVKIIRKVISLRKQDAAKRQEEEALVDLYVASIGGL